MRADCVCGCWLAEALALSGRLDEAQEVLAAHAEVSNHLGLLAEEIDPASGTVIGNSPRAFSHLGPVNAATRIDPGLRLPDEGAEGISSALP
ncbi:MAG: glycoside hydrolase family 15 protein [Myxococcota bacterium]|nr:glycoside hydrolase family 15 protein [Myxococcota bacterium]